MLCPLWSIFQKRETECLGRECGMALLCGVEALADNQRLDECPKGHKNITEVTGSEDKEHWFMCLEDGCDERWSLPHDERRVEELEGAIPPTGR